MTLTVSHDLEQFQTPLPAIPDSLRKSYSCHHDRYTKFIVINLCLSSFMICSKSNMTSVTFGVGTVCPSEHPSSSQLFSCIRVAQSFIFCVVLIIICFFVLFRLAFKLRLLIYPFDVFKLSLSKW
jgi:hypothetical protein